MFGINLDVHTSNCGHHGLYIENQSSTNKIKGLNIRHQSKSDNGGAAATGAPTRWHGLVDGDIWINPTDAYQGFWASGNNTSDAACVVRVHGSIRGATNRWTITSTMCVDIDRIKTNSYRFTCTQFVDTAAITAGGTFNTNNSYIRTFGRFNQDQTTYSLFPKMKNTVSGSDYELLRYCKPCRR